MRPVDVPLLAPIGVTIGSTGAAPWVVDYIKSFRSVCRRQPDLSGDAGDRVLLDRRVRVRSIGGVKVLRPGGRLPVRTSRQSGLGRFTSGPSPYLPFTGDPTAVSTVTGRQPPRWPSLKPGETRHVIFV